MNDKIKAAKEYLGPKWVFANGSTYDAKLRQQGTMCRTLMPVVQKAVKEGRL